MKYKKIEYKIITPSKLAIYYDSKTVIVSGEVTITPIFYANINDFHYWNHPYDNVKITEEEKQEIIDFITNESCKDRETKILFD
jgi:hypothetical protein